MLWSVDGRSYFDIPLTRWRRSGGIREVSGHSVTGFIIAIVVPGRHPDGCFLKSLGIVVPFGNARIDGRPSIPSSVAHSGGCCKKKKKGIVKKRRKKRDRNLGDIFLLYLAMSHPLWA